LAVCLVTVFVAAVNINDTDIYTQSLLTRLVYYDLNWIKPTPLQRGSGNLKLV